MRYRIRLTALLCAAMLFSGALCACGENSDSTSSEYAEFIGQLGLPAGLTFTKPEGFAPHSSDTYEEYYIKDDASIILTEEPLAQGYDTAEAYAKRALEQYTAATEHFALVAQTPLPREDADARTLEFSYTIKIGTEQFSYHCLTGYLLTADTAYIITCKSKEETFEQYRSAFETFISGAAPSAAD